MFVRRLVLSLFLGAVLAGSTVGVSAAGGFKFSSTIDPVPPVLNVPLPAICVLHLDFVKQTTELSCEATAPNPDPPKGRKTVNFTFHSPKGPCKLTAYPDGGVVMACNFKGIFA